MVARTKPEASYASTRLTPRNYNGGPPLSTVQGVRIRRSTGQRESPVIKRSPRPEPATDDEPESSTNDEDERSEGDLSDFGSRGRTREPGMTLQEKLDANNAADSAGGEQTARSTQRGKGSSKSRMGQKRINSFGSADSDEEKFLRFSQNSKRARTRTYGSKMSFNHPGSNVFSSQLQNKTGSVDSMSVLNSPKDPKTGNDAMDKDEENGFKFPEAVELGSTPPRTSSKIRTNNGVQHTTLSSSSLGASSADNYRLFDDDGSGLSTPLSSVSSSFMLELSHVDAELAAAEASHAKQARCPVCKNQVDPELLETFRTQSKQRIRDQLQFCESHQQTSAEQEWREKGYPVIEWEKFDERIRSHFADLERLLVPDSSSFYRNVLVDVLKTGKAKNFRLTLAGDGLETIACGYYGTRGASEMLQALTKHFSRKIYRLATNDPIANKAGVVGYAQSVLVPELAMRLVREDMNADDETARKIMRESIDIGEKMNPAPNDVVPVPEEADESNNQ